MPLSNPLDRSPFNILRNVCSDDKDRQKKGYKKGERVKKSQVEVNTCCKYTVSPQPHNSNFPKPYNIKQNLSIM